MRHKPRPLGAATRGVRPMDTELTAAPTEHAPDYPDAFEARQARFEYMDTPMDWPTQEVDDAE
jgi:hypothetical protein